MNSSNQLTTADLESIIQSTGLTKSKAKEVLAIIRGAIVTAVSNDQQVRIAGLGTFKRSYRKARVARKPGTQEMVDVEAHYVATFKPAAGFKRIIKDSK